MCETLWNHDLGTVVDLKLSHVAALRYIFLPAHPLAEVVRGPCFSLRSIAVEISHGSPSSASSHQPKLPTLAHLTLLRPSLQPSSSSGCPLPGQSGSKPFNLSTKTLRFLYKRMKLDNIFICTTHTLQFAKWIVHAQFRSSWTKFGPMQSRSPFVFAMHGVRAIADLCVLKLPLEPWDDSWKHVGYEHKHGSVVSIQSPMASIISWAAKSVPRR